MRLMDKVLRKDPQKNRGWLRAFRKARLGWKYLSLHRSYIMVNNEPEMRFLSKAEEYLVEAKQTLVHEGLTNTELEKYIDEGLEQIADSYFKAMRRDASRSLKIHR